MVAAGVDLAGRRRDGVLRGRGRWPRQHSGTRRTERPGLALLSGANWPESRAADASLANVRAIRSALAGWGVTTVVVPDPTAVPSTDQGWRAADAVGLITAAVGRLPVSEDSALVWNDVQSSTRPVVLAGGASRRCSRVATNSTSSLIAETRCVMAAARPLG